MSRASMGMLMQRGWRSARRLRFIPFSSKVSTVLVRHHNIRGDNSGAFGELQVTEIIDIIIYIMIPLYRRAFSNRPGYTRASPLLATSSRASQCKAFFVLRGGRLG